MNSHYGSEVDASRKYHTRSCHRQRVANKKGILRYEIDREIVKELGQHLVGLVGEGVVD
jgi:K+-transporting ATPase c subunit